MSLANKFDHNCRSGDSSPEDRFYDWKMFVLLYAIVWTMPLVGTWSRPVGPLKVPELFAAALILYVSFSKRKMLLDITPAGKSLGGFLFFSFVSFIIFTLVSEIPVEVTTQPWATGLRSPPFYNIAKLVQQVLYCALFLIVANVRNKKTLLRVLRGHVLSATTVSLIGITQFVSHFAFGTSFGISNWTVPRVMSTFTEPGPFSAYLLTSLPLLIVLIIHENTDLFRMRILYLLVSVQLLAEFLTFSGRGWVGFVIICGLIVIIELSARHLLMVGTGIISSLVPVALFSRKIDTLVASFVTKFEVFFTAQKSATSSGGRIAGMYIVPQIVQQYPIFGIGTGNYPVLRNYFKPDWMRAVPFLDLPGNHYLQLLAENGVVGLFLFLLAISQLVRSIWNRQNALRSRDRPLVVGTMFASFSMLLMLLVSSVLWFAHVWVLFGLAYAAAKIGQESHPT